MKRKHNSYNLYKKKINNKLVWYVRFWDDLKKKYSLIRSTSLEVEGNNREEAIIIANEMQNYIFLKIPKKLFIEYLENFWKSDSEYMKKVK
jgi:hypothetical protein